MGPIDFGGLVWVGAFFGVVFCGLLWLAITYIGWPLTLVFLGGAVCGAVMAGKSKVTTYLAHQNKMRYLTHQIKSLI